MLRVVRREYGGSVALVIDTRTGNVAVITCQAYYEGMSAGRKEAFLWARRERASCWRRRPDAAA